MKRRKIISVLIIFSLIMAILISILFYTTSFKKNNIYKGYASIARWSFKSQNTEAKISLSENKIYPGSEGNFVIDVDATDSEVDVDYTISVTNEKNIPHNMFFYAEIFDEKGGVIKKTNSYNSFTTLANSEFTSNTIPAIKGNQKRKIVVYWKWKYDANDVSDVDRNDAILSYDENGNSSLDCGFDVEIIGKQLLN